LLPEIVYKIFAIGIVHLPIVEKLRSHRYITAIFPAPEIDQDRRKRTIEEGFFYLQASDICTCLSVWILRACTGHIPTVGPEGDMQVKFSIMFAIQFAVELAIIPLYWIYAKYALKIKDFDPLTTGWVASAASSTSLDFRLTSLSVAQIRVPLAVPSTTRRLCPRSVPNQPRYASHGFIGKE